jgi:hypothetical protein
LATIGAVGLLAVSCTPAAVSTTRPESSTGRWTDKQVSDATGIWINQLGLAQDDPSVWQARLDRICEMGYAPGDAMVDLAAEFVTADAELSKRVDGTLPTAKEAANTLRTIAASVCDK